MYINNIDISDFKAMLTSKDIQTAEIIIFDDWLRNALTPLDLGEQEKYKQIKLQFLIEDSNNDTALNDISNLVKQLIRCTVKFDDVSLYYDCSIVSKNNKKIINGTYTLDIELKSGYAYKPTIAEGINRITSKTINVTGNTETPCIIEITPSIDIIDITLEGFADDPIVIKNLKANKTVIVDGESQTVNIDNINKYGDTDMWDFPRLTPGNNSLKFSRNNCDIKVKYKPRFI